MYTWFKSKHFKINHLKQRDEDGDAGHRFGEKTLLPTWWTEQVFDVCPDTGHSRGSFSVSIFSGRAAASVNFHKVELRRETRQMGTGEEKPKGRDAQ